LPGDHSSITELPAAAASREQHSRLYHRYHTARRYAGEKRVLEIACGAGMGLGCLAHQAGSVVGGDYTEGLLRLAKEHYGDRIPLVRFDAHNLPFRARAFDVAVLFEAIYYMRDAGEVVGECRRVLADDGMLILGSVNSDWAEFTPSLLSTTYFSIPGMRQLLTNGGFDESRVYGAFPTSASSLKQKAVSMIRRAAAALHLVPKTLGGRKLLKRLFYGSLTPLPAEVPEDMAELPPPVALAGDMPNSDYKIIYYVAPCR